MNGILRMAKELEELMNTPTTYLAKAMTQNPHQSTKYSTPLPKEDVLLNWQEDAEGHQLSPEAIKWVASLLEAQKNQLWKQIDKIQDEFIGDEYPINILEKAKDLLNDF